MATKRTLGLVKDGHKYIFRYACGNEDRLVDQIMDMVEDENNNLDWLDAANLSYQVTQYAAEQCAQGLRVEADTTDGGSCEDRM